MNPLKKETMRKLVLFIALFTMTQQSINANNVEKESEDVLEWVYWNTFSKTFIETYDVLKAESAALKAEDESDNILNVEKWLSEIEIQESVSYKNENI